MELIHRGDLLFSTRRVLNSLWQATAEQFYPEHADFTYTRSAGMEFASHLMTGAPAMANRDLANAIAAMSRPPGQIWFHPRTTSEAINKDSTARRWLDYAGNIMRQIMYAPMSGFNRASMETDRSFACIGNGCLRIRPNHDFTGLSFRSRHMRDCAWAEDIDGFVNEIHVKDTTTNRNLFARFPKTVSSRVKDHAESDPHGKVNIRYIILPSDEYDSPDANKEMGPKGVKKRVGHRLRFVSVILDTDNDTVLEEIGQHDLGYVTPRWVTVPGFGYGYSPATVINIADARMLQQITLTLLEAGQKAVDPPMQAVGTDIIAGGVNLFAGGITWIDSDYDERSGPALKPVLATNPNLGWGVDRENRIKDLIHAGHFLNQIKLPDTTHARTAYEVQKLWEEYIRATTPLFEPIGAEYNSPMCDRIFDMLLRFNAFGPKANIPRILLGQDVRFEFESPLTLAASKANAQAFTSVGQITQLAVSMDPTVIHDLDLDTAYRDALDGAGAPATWIVPRRQADQEKAKARQQLAQQQALAQAGAIAHSGAELAGKIGNAATMLQQGGAMPPQAPQQGGMI